MKGPTSRGKASKKGAGKLPATTNSLAPVSKDQASREPPTTISMKDLGAKDLHFGRGLLRQILAANTSESGEDLDHVNVKMMISMIQDMKPQDHVHAALALQMAAVHQNVMKFSELLGTSTTQAGVVINSRVVASLMRTYREQAETHQRYGRANEQGRKVVGSQNAPALPNKIAPPPLAIPYAKPTAMPPVSEPRRVRVPRVQRKKHE
jgi:hypothetical protein